MFQRQLGELSQIAHGLKQATLALRAEPEARSEIMEIGTPRGRGNMLAVQFPLLIEDFFRSEILENRIRTHLGQLEGRGLIDDKTVMVFPEVIGLGLLLSDLKLNPDLLNHEGWAKYEIVKKTWVGLLGALVHRFPDFDYKRLVLAARAQDMVDDYQRIFGDIAKEYGCHVVAGTIPLPEPSVANGRIVIDDRGKFFNTGFLFRPDGTADEKVARKVFLTKEEQGIFTPGKLDALPVYQTPMGRLGILICADAWFPECYKLYSERVDMIAVPIFGGGWDQRKGEIWKGYSGQPAPKDVEAEDVNHITEKAAVEKYEVARTAGSEVHDVSFLITSFRGAFLGHSSYDAIGCGKPSGEEPVIAYGHEAVSVWL